MVRTAREHDERMSFDEYVSWSGRQEERHELVRGGPTRMIPVDAAHARTRKRVADTLRDAIEDADLPCEAFADALMVRTGERDGCVPDALVQLGPPLDPDALEATSPCVVVEIVCTPGRPDTMTKLPGYFRVPGLRHCLVVLERERCVVHYRIRSETTATVSFVDAGTLHLDPPGLDVDVESFFPPRADA